MKPLNVLLVTYSFPPIGGVGVLRAASLARYLPAEGIRLDVLTTRNASAVGADTALLKEIPAEVSIHRTVTFDLPFGIKKLLKKFITGKKAAAAPEALSAPATQSRFLKRAIQDILLPDPQVTWLPVLTRTARRLIKRRRIDLVLITVPPFSSALLVERLRGQFADLTIVVDFRDEWLSTTINLVSFSRSARAFKVARETEAAVVRDASAVVVVTEAARREIRARYPEQAASKFQLIPNGFDQTRLPRGNTTAEPSGGDRIVACFVGTVYGSSEPSTLVKAMLSLPAEVQSRFKLRFIGHIEEPRFRESLLQLGEMVELNGFLPQSEALAAMRNADYALLITHDPLNVAAKFYDYVGAGIPILGTVHPQGDVRRLIEELRAGWWADHRDVEAIRRLFMDAAARGKRPIAGFDADTEKIAGYERKALARLYAALLHRIAAGEVESLPVPEVEPHAELSR